jgi:hypothetical protein
MIPQHPDPHDERPIGGGVLVAGLVAIAAGLLLPVALGSFSNIQTWFLAAVEAVCLAVVAAGILMLSRRLRASTQSAS